MLRKIAPLLDSLKGNLDQCTSDVTEFGEIEMKSIRLNVDWDKQDCTVRG